MTDTATRPDASTRRTPTPAEQVARVRRRVRVGVWAVLCLALLGLLWPTLTAPLMSDERQRYLIEAAMFGGAWWEMFPYTWDGIFDLAHHGRISPFAFILQRVTYVAATSFAVGTGTSIIVGHAVIKLVMLGLAVLSVWALLRALHTQPADGPRRRLSSATVRRAAILFAVLLVAGVQTHAPVRNAWVAFPALTWGAVTVCIGTAWALLRLSDAVARGGRWTYAAAPLLVALALFLNASYELYYVAVPLGLLTLALHAPPGMTRADRWRPKLLVGGVFLGAFLTIFAVFRTYIASVCASEECYSGTAPRIGSEAFGATWVNLASAVPGAGRDKAAADLAALAEPLEVAGPFGGWGWVVAVLAVLATLVLLATPRPRGGRQEAQVESRLLLVVVVIGVALALGTAVIMALSVQAQDEILLGVGEPYRNTMVTWAGLALALGAGSLLLARLVPRALAAPAVVVTLVVLWAGVVVWPVNMQASQVQWTMPGNAAIYDLHRAVTEADLSPAGEAHRCELHASATERLQFATGRSAIRAAERAFELYHDQPFCPTLEDSDAP